MTLDPKFAALAKLRPMMPPQALVDAMGDAWRGSIIHPDGNYWPGEIDEGMVRFDDQGRIGSLSFYRNFPSDLFVDGLHIGMPFQAVKALHPAMRQDAAYTRDSTGTNGYRCAATAGHDIVMWFENDALVGLILEWPGATYPVPASPKTYPKPDGIRAYDLDMLHREVDRTAPDNHGWVFGLPPGITPEQWPLDPISGYPLMHGFTVKLPEEYRVHGPEIVALSFFATATDQNDGGARKREDLHAAVTDANAPPPDNRHLLTFWKQAKASHPRLHRMSDILDYEYAVILLTETEFNGPLSQPPQLGANPYLDAAKKPQWMSVGSGFAQFSDMGGLGLGDRPVEELYIYKMLGAIPEQRLDWNRAIGCTPRAQDLNAGLAPMDAYGDGPTETGYLNYNYYEGGVISAETYREHEWAKNHKPNHIGGTMRPVQATPAFSPFYIGFEEDFGGYNFGAGGNAQLDFLEMKFDWACG
jgi:hypothetical protein